MCLRMFLFFTIFLILFQPSVQPAPGTSGAQRLPPLQTSGGVQRVRPVQNPAIRNGPGPVPPPSGPSRVTIQGDNGRFVSSNNGDQPLLCDRTIAGPWETFDLENVGNGKVALKSMGKYISSENGDAPMTCKRTVAGDWEKFELFYHQDGMVSLKGSNGKYVSSEGGKNPMTCNRLIIGPWEKFWVR
uniref:Uncharacterized protein n=1 Tax=Acrobeloides nanus TaxID=290746 RepID=A0A914E986_9BILA